MTAGICLYFHVHQPMRLKRHSVFAPPNGGSFEDEIFDARLSREYFERAAAKCYLPTNAALLELIGETGLKVSFSVSGVFLEQAMRWQPAVVESFRKLAQTGNVEFVNETYYHSLSSLWWDKREFREQVLMHRNAVESLCGNAPTAFRNTELLYSDDIAAEAGRLGLGTVLAEGADRVLAGRSPNFVYSAAGTNGKVKVLLRNYRLSDDLGFRFGARGWPEWPLTADKYADWIAASGGDTVNLFLDFETFGEHHWAESGIFDFLRRFPKAAGERGLVFRTISETARDCPSAGELSVPSVVSWADAERDASTWLGNRIQQHAFSELMKARPEADGPALAAHRMLQTSDHFMYMSTKGMGDGEVHKHFSPYKDWGPYENYINFMNSLSSFRRKAVGKEVLVR